MPTDLLLRQITQPEFKVGAVNFLCVNRSPFDSNTLFQISTHMAFSIVGSVFSGVMFSIAVVGAIVGDQVVSTMIRTNSTRHVSYDFHVCEKGMNINTTHIDSGVKSSPEI